MNFPARQKAIDAEQNPLPHAKMKLLLVDSEQNLPAMVDDAINRDFLVDLAFDGPSALVKIRESAPDIIMVDVAEKDVRGYELIRFLVDEQGTKEIPVIAMGPKDSNRTLEEKIRAEKNVRAYLRKPFVYEGWKPLIEEVMKKSRDSRRVRESVARVVPQLVDSSRIPDSVKSMGDLFIVSKANKWVAAGFWALAAFGVLMGSIILVEASYRFMETRHQQTIFNPAFGASDIAGVPIRFPALFSWDQDGKTYSLNDWALRGPNIDLVKPPNTYRVLVLGGTDLFGEGVSEEDTLTARVQAQLQESRLLIGVSRVEVLNGGLWGLSEAEQWSYYEAVVSKLRPDMLIWLWGTEGSRPYQSERLKAWSLQPRSVQAVFSFFHALRPFRQRYWREGSSSAPVNYSFLVKQARTFTERRKQILIIGAPVSIPINFPTEPEYHEVQQKYFFFGTGERPQSGPESVWSSQDHESFAGMVEKYILLAYPDGIRSRRSN